jgi:hypothetical protein
MYLISVDREEGDLMGLLCHLFIGVDFSAIGE